MNAALAQCPFVAPGEACARGIDRLVIGGGHHTRIVVVPQASVLGGNPLGGDSAHVFAATRQVMLKVDESELLLSLAARRLIVAQVVEE